MICEKMTDAYGSVDSITDVSDAPLISRLARLIAQHAHVFTDGYQFDIWPDGQIDMRPMCRAVQSCSQDIDWREIDP